MRKTVVYNYIVYKKVRGGVYEITIGHCSYI